MVIIAIKDIAHDTINWQMTESLNQLVRDFYVRVSDGSEAGEFKWKNLKDELLVKVVGVTNNHESKIELVENQEYKSVGELLEMFNKMKENVNNVK